MKLGEIFSYSAKQGLTTSEKLLVGITRDNFARFARPSGHPIRSNHPSFIIGHLSLYGPRILNDLGLPSDQITIPESYTTLYSKDAQCVDDPDHSIYPEMAEVVETFFDSYRITIEQIKTVPNEAYDKPNTNTAAVARFPTIAAMHCYYLSGHMMQHLGQLSAWRRAAGLAPA